MSERQLLEDLLKDAEAIVARIKAQLSKPPPNQGSDDIDASTGTAIERVQSQKTSDDTGNW